jgi:hypothetical protein
LRAIFSGFDLNIRHLFFENCEIRSGFLEPEPGFWKPELEVGCQFKNSQIVQIRFRTWISELGFSDSDLRTPKIR